MSSGQAVAESPRLLLHFAASAERASEHPPAEAIVEYAKAEGVTLSEVEAFDPITGRGIEATVDGRQSCSAARRSCASAR